MDLSAVATAWRDDGYVVLPNYLEGAELDAALGDLGSVYPSVEAYHANPLMPTNQRFADDEFGGIIAFPFPSVALCNLVVCDRLIELAEAIFETGDLRVYASELWAKYSGATCYEQELHRDYLNHTPLVPSGDHRWRGLEMFVWLSDVPESLGPTHIVALGDSAGVPVLPHVLRRSEYPNLYDAEVSGAGGVGTVIAYSTETLHRATELVKPRSARFSAHVSYRHGDAQWLERHAWGDRSFLPEWGPFVEQASSRQLLLFGFPPPAHPYWTEQTLMGMRMRYPGLDLAAWEVARTDR